MEISFKDFIFILENMYVTLFEAITGMFFAVVLGSVLSFFMYSSKTVYRIIYPGLCISQSVPIVCVAPFFVTLLGYGVVTKIFVVGITCFFPVTMSLLNGIQDVDEDKILLLKTMRASKNQIFRYVLLPSSRAHFFSGLKIAMSYAMISAVIAEWIGGERGIGIYMLRVKRSYQTEKLLIGIFILCVCSFFLVEVVKLLEKRKFKKTVCIITVGFLILGSAKGMPKDESGKTFEKITFVLDYTPNTNHTGLYVAKALGFFEQEGLEVEVRQPPQDGAVEMILANDAQFGIDFQDQLALFFENDSRQNDLTVLATILQHNTAVIISKKEKQILSLQDLNNKTFATSINPIEEAIITKMFKNNLGINFLRLDSSDVISTINTNVDAMCCYYAWDVTAAKLRGQNINEFFYKDVDPQLDFYTSIIIGNANFIKHNKELTKKFMTALTKGFTYAAQNPEKSAQILCDAVPELDRRLVEESQKWISKEYVADATIWGQIDKFRWNSFYKWLFENGVTKQKLYEKDVFWDG